LARRSLVAQPGAAAADGDATACGDNADEAGADEAGAEAAVDAAEDEGAANVVDAEDTGGGGAEDELPAAHPATTAPAAANPAILSNNEKEPVITNHPF
jgi:hypothetical protein